jgi:hypothetical protein
MQARLPLRFQGASPRSLVECALAARFLPDHPPSAIYVDGAPASIQPVPALVETADDLSVTWEKDARLMWGRRHDDLFLLRSRWDASAENLLALLRDLPFESCLTGNLVPSWWEGYNSMHGWAFALKGTGHRLVSPRILERGPWRLLRDAAHELTVIQFHDVDVDGPTALAQARPGHALLAPVWLGGHYAGRDWAFRGRAESAGYKPLAYDKATQTSIILVQDREVTPAEMGIAAATRIHQIFTEPVAQVAFVYMDEAMARRQLPALWLYGLEVRAMTAQGERRIDLDYQPPPAR